MKFDDVDYLVLKRFNMLNKNKVETTDDSYHCLSIYDIFIFSQLFKTKKSHYNLNIFNFISYTKIYQFKLSINRDQAFQLDI